MVRTGQVKNGTLVLDDGSTLADGTRVRIETIEEQLPTLAERYKGIIGIAKGLPSDFAENHDHYIHGLPKKKKQ